MGVTGRACAPPPRTLGRLVCTSRLLHPPLRLISCLSPKAKWGKHSTATGGENFSPPALHLLPSCLLHSAQLTGSHTASAGVRGLGCVDEMGLGATAAAPLHDPIHLSSAPWASLRVLSPILSNKGVFLSRISSVLPKQMWGAPSPLSPRVEPTTYPGVPSLLPPSRVPTSGLPRLSSPRPAVGPPAMLMGEMEGGDRWHGERNEHRHRDKPDGLRAGKERKGLVKLVSWQREDKAG